MLFFSNFASNLMLIQSCGMNVISYELKKTDIGTLLKELKVKHKNLV